MMIAVLESDSITTAGGAVGTYRRVVVGTTVCVASLGILYI